MTIIGRRAILAGMLAAAAAAGIAQAQDSGPQAPVQVLDDALLQIMRAGRATPFAQRAAMLTPVVQRSFALDSILATIVGLDYRSMPPADQAALLAAFTDYTVASYVANFDSYSGERFEIAPQTRTVGSAQVVSTRIVPASGAATTLGYVLRNGPGGWQIVDVLVDGSISRVAVQRSDFRSLLSGGQAGPLIKALRDRVARLAGGGNS